MATACNYKSALFTFPHCDCPNKELQEIFLEHPKFKNNIKYLIVATEHHQDGEEHKHVFIMLHEKCYFSRTDIENQFDILRIWSVDEDGFTLPDTTYWYRMVHWFCFFNRDDQFPKAGVDTQDAIFSSRWLRRFHCNFEGVRSPKNVIEYCKKENNYLEYGESPVKVLTKAERNKLLLEKPLEKLVEDGDVSILAIKQLKIARQILQDERTQQTYQEKRVRWFFGPTGTGKTRTAWEEAKAEYGDDIWCSSSDDAWFDGYEGQKAVILDDVRADTWKFSKMLRLTDRYPLRVAIKGGFVKWVPESIWITAPVEPRELYKNYSTGMPFDGIEQLERRVTEQREFTDESPETEPIDSFIQKEC